MRTTISLTLATVAALAAIGCGGDDEPAGEPAGADPAADGGQVGFEAELAPLNESGLEGEVIVSQTGDLLRVQVQASGATPGEEHLLQLQALEGDAPGACPTEEADAALLELAPAPVADADGELLFMGSFDAGPDLLPLEGRAVVVQGLEVDGEYATDVPAACGILAESSAG